MEIKEIKLSQALDKNQLLANGYQYIWMQEISDVQLTQLEKVELNEDELLEARIFNNTSEIHIFEYDGLLKAVLTETHPTDQNVKNDHLDFTLTHYRERTQLLRVKYGKKLTLRDFIGYDDDGLAYVTHTVLCDLDMGGVQ